MLPGTSVAGPSHPWSHLYASWSWYCPGRLTPGLCCILLGSPGTTFSGLWCWGRLAKLQQLQAWRHYRLLWGGVAPENKLIKRDEYCAQATRTNALIIRRVRINVFTHKHSFHNPIHRNVESEILSWCLKSRSGVPIRVSTHSHPLQYFSSI